MDRESLLAIALGAPADADYTRLLDGLDPAQRAGVLAGPGLTVIEAGAGTGKTRTLTTRIALLVILGEIPESIVSVTFTRNAAAQMRERALAFEIPGVERVTFSTLHKLAARILYRHWEAAGLTSQEFIIVGDEKKDVIAEAIDASDFVGPRLPGEETQFAQARRQAIKIATKVIDRWKENGLTREAVQDEARDRRSTEIEALAQIYLGYQDGMQRRNLIDFGDLTMMAVQVLEKFPAIRKAEAARIRWLMVDEWQDTNRIQLRLVNLLASEGASVTVVGDDDQSLYSFRGAIPRLMERTAELMPNTAMLNNSRVRLITNRRSTTEILVPANMIVDHNPRQDPKVLESEKTGSAVTVSAHASDSAEADAVVRKIEALVESGVDRGEIAILARTKNVLDEIEKALIKNRIPHAMQAGTPFMERSEVQDILAYLKLAMNPTLDLAFERISSRPTRGLGPAAVKAILDTSRNRGVSIADATAFLAESGGFKSDARESAVCLSRHLSILAGSSSSDAKTIDLVDFILDDMGYLAWAESRKDVSDRLPMIIRQIKDIARSQPRLSDFLIDAAISQGEEGVEGEVVHVGTLHGSKGLEWDHVILPGFEEGVLPNGRVLDEADKRHDPDDIWETISGGGLEEERRLAHVGLTRARISAHISFSVMRKVYGRPTPAKPSRFLAEGDLPVPRPARPNKPSPQARGGKAKRRRELW